MSVICLVYAKFDPISRQNPNMYSDEYRLLGLKQFVINAVTAYPWSDKNNMRVEVLMYGSIVTKAEDLVVIRGPPPSNLRISRCYAVPLDFLTLLS